MSLSAAGVVNNDFLFLVRDRAGATAASASSTSSTTATATASAATATAGGRSPTHPPTHPPMYTAVPHSPTSRCITRTPHSPTHLLTGGLRSLNDLPPNQTPEQLMSTLNANPRLLAELRHHNEPLATAIASGDVVKVRSVQMKQKLQAMAARVEEQQAMQALEANPMDPEAQRKIEEMIQRENVLRNMEMAMEEMPEAFGSVVMLYVDVEVNGHLIKAFVDSGAQSTIMSAACATRCGLSRLIDTRFAGIAKGYVHPPTTSIKPPSPPPPIHKRSTAAHSNRLLLTHPPTHPPTPPSLMSRHQQNPGPHPHAYPQGGD